MKGFGARVKYTRSFINDAGSLTVEEVVKTSSAIIHPDLREALNRLDPMFKGYFQLDDQAPFVVQGAKALVLNSGVTEMAIIGRIHIENGEEIKVTAKKILDNVDVWDWIGRLNKAMKVLADEALKYVDGKSAQLEIEYEDKPSMALDA